MIHGEKMEKNLQKKKSCIIEYYLPFYIMLAPYKFGIIDLGTIGLIICAFLMLLRENGRIIFKKSQAVFFTFLGYAIIKNIFNLFLGDNSFDTIFNKVTAFTVIFILCIFVTAFDFDEDALFKAYKFAGVIFSLGLIYQLIKLYAFGAQVTPISIIPGYVLRGEVAEESLRPSSFFSEPASYVTAMMPLEFLSLKKLDYKWAGFSTVMILASTSTVGVVLSAVLWLTVLGSNKVKFKSKAVIAVFIAVICTAFLTLNIFSGGNEKLKEVLDGESTVNSRIVVGFDTIATMDPVKLIFGENYNDPNAYVRDNNGLLRPDSPVKDYIKDGGHIFLNTFCRLIFDYGIIGLIIFLYIYRKRLRTPNYGAKPFIIMSLVAIFAQSSLLNSIFFMNIMLLMLYDTKLEKEVYDEDRSCNYAVCE